jgi:regulator of replication initiation timing
VQSTLSQNKKENLKIDDIIVLKKLVQSLQAENKMLKIEIERLQNLKSQGSKKKAA